MPPVDRSSRDPLLRLSVEFTRGDLSAESGAGSVTNLVAGYRRVSKESQKTLSLTHPLASSPEM